MNMVGPKVAIVDDDEHVRRALRRMVSSLSYFVEEFPSGKTFLAALEERVFACVLLDLHMPELNGIDVLTRMRGDGHAVPVILITGGDEPKMRERCLKAGASIYLVKPVARDAVLGAIHSLAGLPEQIGPQT
jgi:FixJ family two-component response regulator